MLFLLFFWPVGIVLMWMKSCTWSKAVKAIVSVVLVALIAWNVSVVLNTLNSVNSAITSSSSPSVVDRLDNGSQSGSSSSGSNSGSSGSSSGSSGSGSSSSSDSGLSAAGKIPAGVNAVNLTDDKGNITAYALINLDGNQLLALASDQGMTYNTIYEGWLSKDSTSTLDGETPYDSWLDESAFRQLPTGAWDSDVALMSTSENEYLSLADALAGMNKADIVDSVNPDDTFYAAVAKNVEGKRFFIMATFQSDKNMVNVVAVPESMIQSGAFGTYMDDSSYPTDLDALWAMLAS